MLKDFRYGVRSLWQRPGFVAIVVGTLALGIGVNAAIFSLVYAVLLRPLPFPGADGLVVVANQNARTGEKIPSVSPADFFDSKSQAQSFSSLAAYSGMPLTLLDGEQSELVSATRVTDEFFNTLAVPPLLGRTFAKEEFVTDSNVVILSERLWQRRFAGDTHIINRTLTTAHGQVTVVGVMPAQFKLPAYAEAWVPVAQDSSEMKLRAARYFETVGRLKPNVTATQAEGEMRTIAARLAEQYPESDSNWSVGVTSLREKMVGDSRLSLWLLLGAVGLVLLIACGNVANLMLARATSRIRELAIRAALGASRWRIVRQLIAESLLLSAGASALGLLLAVWGVNAIVWLVPKDFRFPRIEEAQVNLVVLLFALAIGLVVSVALGLICGVKASRANLQDPLKETSTTVSTGLRLQRLRGALVVSEIALTLVLLAGAGLLFKSLMKLEHVELGFNHENLLVVPVGAAMPKYADPQARGAFFERLVAQVQSVPGVQSVATTSTPPLMYTMFFPFNVEGRNNPNEVPQAWFSAVSPNYFDVMHIAPLNGRLFTDHERFGTARVAIISDTMRRRYFPNEDPIGRRLVVNYLNSPLPVEIVGVVRDIRQESPQAEPNAHIYLSYLQVPWFSTALLIHTTVAPETMMSSVERALHAVDPSQSATAAKTMDQLAYDSVAQPRFYSLLIGSFAVLALVLAMVGIYGVVSYSVVQRTHEMGIRVALGAQAQHVLRLVIGQAMKLVLLGAAIGLGAAFLLTRLLTKFLFDVKAGDPMTFGAVALLMAFVALIACYVPARRATKVDPLVALRYE